jgi:hypothetical protein
MLIVRAERPSTITLQASMRTLRLPFDPCSLSVNGRPLPDDAWSFDPGTGVLRAGVQGRSVSIEARACR